jgi:hypothetical protein
MGLQNAAALPADLRSRRSGHVPAAGGAGVPVGSQAAAGQVAAHGRDVARGRHKLLRLRQVWRGARGIPAAAPAGPAQAGTDHGVQSYEPISFRRNSANTRWLSTTPRGSTFCCVSGSRRRCARQCASSLCPSQRGGHTSNGGRARDNSGEGGCGLGGAVRGRGGEWSGCERRVVRVRAAAEWEKGVWRVAVP